MQQPLNSNERLDPIHVIPTISLHPRTQNETKNGAHYSPWEPLNLRLCTHTHLSRVVKSSTMRNEKNVKKKELLTMKKIYESN